MEDRIYFLNKLKKYSSMANLQVAAYCLMDNHAHFVVIPGAKDSIAMAFKTLLMCYSQRLNKSFERLGANWQGRFFSSPMDDGYTWNAFRYIALNPVNAGIVCAAEDYQWSSARTHMANRYNEFLNAEEKWLEMAHRALIDLPGSSRALEQAFTLLNRNTLMNLPSGSEEFVKKIGSLVNRNLVVRARGRPRL